MILTYAVHLLNAALVYSIGSLPVFMLNIAETITAKAYDY
jgi:hypothetical protein